MTSPAYMRVLLGGNTVHTIKTVRFLLGAQSTVLFIPSADFVELYHHSMPNRL